MFSTYGTPRPRPHRGVDCFRIFFKKGKGSSAALEVLARYGMLIHVTSLLGAPFRFALRFSRTSGLESL